MKKQKALYQDVVVGGEHRVIQEPQKQPPEASERSESSKDSPEHDKTTEPDNSTDKKDKSGGKDEKTQTEKEDVSDKLVEDPFMTEAEMKNSDGGSKEKQKKTKDNNSQDEARQSKKDLDILAGRADKILFSAKSIFPFDFFPDSITIDANKINIILKSFFFSETITSILLKEVMDVRVETALFVSKLIIDYGPHPLKIHVVYVANLKKVDALKAKEIIEGILVVYRGENIDTTKLKPEDTIDEIKEVGKMDEREDLK